MCGIAGIVGKSNISYVEKRIKNMTNSLIHRGPNACGYEIYDGRIAFGHRRLSIIDLHSGANQPMRSNNQRWSIIFNGEIYNYKEIKRELSYNFKTNSDTEIILASVEMKGINWFLEKANGMFAIALFDHVKDSIYLIRDRFSIKPLYYSVSEEVLVFSSEIKAILKSGLIRADFFSDAVDEYLANRYVREPYTFFKGIYQVEAGSYIEVNRDLKVKKSRYWELPPLNFDKTYDEESIIEETESRVTEAIKRWLVADVKVGAYLSGGVDSSLIAAIIACSLEKQVDTYTIGFCEKGFNEFPYARMVAEKYNTHHTEMIINYSDYRNEWERLIWYKDAPLSVPNEIPLAIMSTRLSKDITVVISGEGADELFGGYGRIYRLPFDYRNYENSFYQSFISEYEYVAREIRNTYLNTDFPLRSLFDNIISNDFNKHKNEENVFRYFHNYHIKGLLHRVDMATMQASVEARTPFLDHELVEYVYEKVPFDLKLKWNNSIFIKRASTLKAKQYSEILDTPKYILKKIASKYLPKEIIERKKVGFPVPLTKWLPDMKQNAIELLAFASWFNTKKLSQLIEDVSSNNNAGQFVWMLMNVEMFKRKYFNTEWRY